MATTAMERRTEVRSAHSDPILHVLRARGCRCHSIGKHVLITHTTADAMYQAIADSVRGLVELNRDLNAGQHPESRWMLTPIPNPRSATRPEPVEAFDPDIWEKRADGYLHRCGRRTWGEIARHLKPALDAMTFEGERFEAVTEYLHWHRPAWYDGATNSGWNATLPTWDRICAWACTGGSEGWYVHVDAITEHPALKEGKQHATLILFKTFSGWDVAVQVAAAISRLLGA